MLNSLVISSLVTALPVGLRLGRLRLKQAVACSLLAGLSWTPVALADGAKKPPANAAQTLFFSGHSLLDNPLPDDVVAIAKSLGQRETAYNQQNIAGSPLRVRTRGMDPRRTDWPGYQSGKSRDAAAVDVLSEFAKPRAVGSPYTTLVITERHDLASVVIWEDTVRYLRHYHDRLVAANEHAVTYFYQPWLGLRGNNDPASWVAYERAADPVWRCVGTRINQSLTAEGRPDRIRPLAANLALAELVEQATQGQVPGITQDSAGKTFATLVSDGVHLTRVGVYYMALVTYAVSHERSPAGAWAPSGVGKALAAELQGRAWVFAQQQATAPALSLPQCSALMRDTFCARYSSYAANEQTQSCQKHFADSNPDNPFRFQSQSDKSYWLPAP